MPPRQQQRQQQVRPGRPSLAASSVSVESLRSMWQQQAAATTAPAVAGAVRRPPAPASVQQAGVSHMGSRRVALGQAAAADTLPGSGALCRVVQVKPEHVAEADAPLGPAVLAGPATARRAAAAHATASLTAQPRQLQQPQHPPARPREPVSTDDEYCHGGASEGQEEEEGHGAAGAGGGRFTEEASSSCADDASPLQQQQQQLLPLGPMAGPATIGRMLKMRTAGLTPLHPAQRRAVAPGAAMWVGWYGMRVGAPTRHVVPCP